MKTTFFILLVVEILALLKLGIASDRESGEAGIGDAMGFFAVLFFSIVIDIVYAIVWAIVRHHH